MDTYHDMWGFLNALAADVAEKQNAASTAANSRSRQQLKASAARQRDRQSQVTMWISVPDHTGPTCQSRGAEADLRDRIASPFTGRSSKTARVISAYSFHEEQDLCLCSFLGREVKFSQRSAPVAGHGGYCWTAEISADASRLAT